MLVGRLVEYARRDGAGLPLHRERSFDWRLALGADGRPESRELLPLTTADGRGRVRGTVHAVPSTVRTAGVAANLAADDAQYVLGWADADSKQARVTQCHAAFVDLTRRWAESPAGFKDDVAQAVCAFYRDGGAALIERPEGCGAKAGVLITVAGMPAYRAESVPSFWAEEVARRKGSTVGTGLCLACGRLGPLLDTLPGKVPSRLVPGATNDAALISVNADVFGYDLTTQLGASPLCMSCGEAVTAGLIRALGPEHSTAYGGQDCRMAWWTTEPSTFDPMAALHKPSPEEVTSLMQTVHVGQAPGHDDQVGDPARFCSLSVGGNVARVVVRDWVEMPLDEVRRHVGHWFDDHEIAPVARDGRRHHGVGQFALVCGRWLRDRSRYADFGAKGADRPAGVHRDLVRAALRRTPLPLSLLAHLVHRIRTDGHLDDTRAALVRLVLTRHPHITEKPMPQLDEQNNTPAYVAGRMFAVLEQIQYDVTGGGLNATYGDRHFAGAISNPRAAIVSGRRDATAWLKKLRRTSEKKQGAAVRHEKELDALFGLIGPDTQLPARTSLSEQALFLLGYHHQRAHRFAQIAAAKAASAGNPDTDSTETS
jgi:CRISPR-associated protein Csd1